MSTGTNRRENQGGGAPGRPKRSKPNLANRSSSHDHTGVVGPRDTAVKEIKEIKTTRLKKLWLSGPPVESYVNPTARKLFPQVKERLPHELF